MKHDQAKLKINPAYEDCPDFCGKTGEELTDFCKNCPSGKIYNEMLQNIDGVLKRFDKKEEYTKDVVISDYGNTRKIMRNFKDGYSRDWDILTMNLVDIVRFEEFLADKEAHWKDGE